jgi:putative effector of murein hydrolase
MLSPIQSPQRLPRTQVFTLVPASLTSTPTQSTAGCTEGTYLCLASKSATGVFTIALNAPYKRVPNVQATSLSSAGVISTVVSAKTASSITVKTYTSNTGAAVDPTSLDIHVSGFDATDQQG